MRAAAVLLLAAAVAAGYGFGAVAVLCLTAATVTFLGYDPPMVSAQFIRSAEYAADRPTGAAARESK